MPGDQYSQKKSMAEDARLDNHLTMDLSRQMKHPLATMSADADKCYDRINHIIMSILLLAIVGSIGSIMAMLFPIQTMKFFQRTARGDSNTFMGGRSKENPLQGLCQGNGAGPTCWLMLSSMLMHCYKHQGFGLRIISCISGAIIDFLGEIYVEDMDLIITRPEFTTEKETQEGLWRAAWAWASGLNATGRAINSEKKPLDICRVRMGKWQLVLRKTTGPTNGDTTARCIVCHNKPGRSIDNRESLRSMVHC